jgi:hypothetical protein
MRLLYERKSPGLSPRLFYSLTNDDPVMMVVVMMVMAPGHHNDPSVTTISMMVMMVVVVMIAQVEPYQPPHQSWNRLPSRLPLRSVWVLKGQYRNGPSIPRSDRKKLQLAQR